MVDAMTSPSDTARPSLRERLQPYRYRLLVAGLFQHLFIGLVMPDLMLYAYVFWPLGMVVLVASTVGALTPTRGVLFWVERALSVAIVAVIGLPVFFGPSALSMLVVSVVYITYFALLAREVFRFLLRHGETDLEVVFASVAGYLLLLEVGVFGSQTLVYGIPGAFTGIHPERITHVYIDIVYFCSMTITSIGYGDIAPVHYVARLWTSLLGIAGQLYVVLLMGILVSRYSGREPAETTSETTSETMETSES